jgi:hypothetical protein
MNMLVEAFALYVTRGSHSRKRRSQPTHMFFLVERLKKISPLVYGAPILSLKFG